MTVTDFHVEPLEATRWLDEWDKLSRRRALLDGEAPDASIRKAYYLLQMAPICLRTVTAVRVTEETIEAFLDCGAYLSAAISLLGAETGISLVRDTNKKGFECTVSLLADAPPGRETIPSRQRHSYAGFALRCKT